MHLSPQSLSISIHFRQDKAIPMQASTGPEGCKRLGAPTISTQSAHRSGKVVSTTHRPPLSPGNFLGTHFCCRLSRPQGHNAAVRIPMENRTFDLPACSAVPQPTVQIERYSPKDLTSNLRPVFLPLINERSV